MPPMFWHLDGCNQDEDFAFDTYHKTREEWEQAQRESEEHSRKFDAEWEERKRLGVNDTRDKDSAWSRSISLSDIEVPVGIRVFSFGCELAELIVALRADSGNKPTPSEAQRHIDQVNRDFGNLREVLQGSDSSLAESLFTPIVDRFIDDLGAVATEHPYLTDRCESLTSDLQQLLDPPSNDSSDWDGDDSELPF